MNEDDQGRTSETEHLAKTLWGGQWFWPILEELQSFEQATAHLFPEVNDAIADDAPDWVFDSLWKCGLEWKSFNGLGDPRKLDSRRVGTMVGMKWSLCDAYARSFPIWGTLKPEQIREIDAAWFPFFCHGCTEFTREFAEKWSPLCIEIMGRAGTLACQKGLKDYVDYLQGYTQGIQFMAKVLEKMRPSKHKTTQEAKIRNCIRLFAMCCGREIEEGKGDLSWKGLNDKFDEFYDHKVETDTETLKQILTRSKLKGVGKVGRPVQIVSPKKRR